MAESRERAGAARPRCGSKKTLSAMRVVKKASDEGRERRSVRLVGGAEIEAKEGETNIFSRIVAGGKLSKEKGELKMMKKDN